MRKVITASLLALLICNEVISLAALCVIGAVGVSKLLKAAAEGGVFD